jgi:ParB family transcriptional regulator, chromosome partitioning protein
MRNPTVQSAHFQSIALARINLQDDTFRITTRTDVNDLLESIRYDGLITPPLLIKKNSTFIIVSGFRRIAACRKLDWDYITARILKANIGVHDCLRLAIAENAHQRSLNLIETSRCLQKLSLFITSSKRLTESASSLGLPDNPSMIDKIKNLSLLPGPIQISILADTISLTMAKELESLEADCAIAFTRLFDQLKIGLNKQKEIVTLVKEIARRDGLSTQEVMEDKHFIEIITHRDLDRGQKSRKLRSYLRQRRYPRIAAAEKTFEIHRKNLNLGNDIKLIPPREFEATAYGLNLTFTNIEHLKTLQTRLNKIIQLPDFKKILGHKDHYPDQDQTLISED